jgi:hypothetical protein
MCTLPGPRGTAFAFFYLSEENKIIVWKSYKLLVGKIYLDAFA